MLPVRLIAMDMDGTLLNTKQKISKENLSALQKAESQGVQLAVCSGRIANDVSFFLSDAGLSRCAVLSLNGACCLYKPHGTPYELFKIATDASTAVARILIEEKVTFAAFQAERVLVVQNDPYIPKMSWGTYVDREKPNAYAFGEPAVLEGITQGICKFVAIDQPGSERLQRIKEQLLLIPGLAVTSSWNDNLEIMPENVGKGTALSNFAMRRGIPREQTAAIGDYDNDLDMITCAGVGIAMGNASAAVVENANFITTTNADNGVAKAIEKLLSGEWHG